jgi:natural product precursor
MKLDRIKLNAMVDLLKDQEMKMMKGGDGVNMGSGSGGTCSAYIPVAGASSYSIPHPSYGNLPSGSYGYGSVTGTTAATIWRGITRDTALQMTQGIPGAKWCCDSCNNASWY